MGQRKGIKLEDIAKELGISIVSVSNALKGKKGVGEELRMKVQQKAEEMGYQVSRVPEKKENRCYRIGVIIAERYVKEYPSFYMDIYKLVAQEAVRRGNLVMLQLVDDEKEMQENLPVFFPDADIQGVIVIGEMKAKFIRNMKNQICVPLVCIDFYGMEEDIDYIVPDNFHGSAFLTQTLVDAGHKDIGFIGTPTATNSIMDRYMGYCKALAENGLSERRKWLIFDRQEDGYGYKVDFELPDELPTAFVCNCDKTAYLLIAKLKEKDLAVPEDISVVGFDNSYPERGEKKKLVTYEVDTNAMAQIGVNTLLKRMEGKGNPEKIRIVESRIIEGDTVEELRR